MRNSILPLLLALIPASGYAQSLGFSFVNDGSDHLTVTVLDESTMTPISDATVSIADKTVTVSKVGYASLSVAGVQGGQMTAYLHPLSQSPKTVVASGTITTWDNIGTDKSIAHAGLVFRTVSASDLLSFQISNFVSPLKDTLDLGSIAGKHDIPSNIVIPDQKVRYSIFTLELDKSNYRLPIPAGEEVGLTGVEVHASVSDLVSAASSKKFDVGLLNKIQFDRVGATQSFVTDSDLSRDVDAGSKIVPTHQVQIAHLPPFTADVIAASFVDVNGDKSVLVPSDAKAIYDSQTQQGPNAVTLGSPDQASPSQRDVATVAVGADGTQISGVLVSNAGSAVQTGDFLDTSSLPQNQPLPASVSIQAPAQGIATAIFETDQPVWYVYALPSAGSVNIPTSQLESQVKVQSYSLNQMEFSGFNANQIDGTKIMSQIQRFARSSAKIE